jgi:hypothetical protein
VGDVRGRGEEAQSNDPVKVARALEGMKMSTSLGEVEMRADNHQLLQPLYVSTLSQGREVRQRGLGPRLEDRRQDRGEDHGPADHLQDGAAEVSLSPLRMQGPSVVLRNDTGFPLSRE